MNNTIYKNHVVLLIYPKIGENLPFPESPPYNILTLASYLKNKGIPVKVFDQRLSRNWKNDLIKLLNNNIILAGITSMTGIQIKYGLKISQFIKKENKNIKIVWGGVHVSLIPEESLKNKYIDFIIVGEGEKSLFELAQSLIEKKSINKINNLGYKNDETIQINPIRNFINMD